MKKLNKETLGYWTAALAFLFAFALTIAGFIVPPLGEVHESILWILAQALLYVGSIVGITTHYNAELNSFKFRINRFVHDEGYKKNNFNDIDSDNVDNSLDDRVEENE